jgi:hypothetical protein
MENLNWKEDPVIEEIRAIRDAIHEETKGLSNEELVSWYQAQAAETMREFRESRAKKSQEDLEAKS